MKLFVFLATLSITAMAQPIGEQVVSVTQDTLGRYKLAVNTHDLSRVEESDGNGHVNGAYSYVDANGELQNVQYTAGQNGFVATGSALPVAPVDYNTPVQDTPEVAHARAIHLAKLAEAGL